MTYCSTSGGCSGGRRGLLAKAVLEFPDGRWFGHWLNYFNDHLDPRIYRTAAKRNTARTSWAPSRNFQPCGCIGEMCVVVDDGDEPATLIMGQACRRHNVYLGPRASSSNPNVIPDMGNAFMFWNDCSSLFAEARREVREHRIEASRVFEPALRMWAERVRFNVGFLPPSFEEIIAWTD